MNKDLISNCIDIITIIYIALPLLVILFLGIYYLIGKRLSATALATIIDVGKWYLATVAVVFLGKMIESGYTERETGMKEMAVYDKYTSIVMHTDSVDKIWALTRYFATVTPTTRLRNGWIAYYAIIDTEYAKIQKERSTLLAVQKDTTLTPEQKKDSIANTDARISSLQSSIVIASNVLEPPAKNGAVQQLTKPAPVAPAPAPVANENNSEPFYWEREGFEALLHKDVQAAITAFNKSEQAQHGFHMVYDIWYFLRKQKAVLQAGDDEAWKNCYRTILSQYSWRMPADIKERFNALK